MSFQIFGNKPALHQCNAGKIFACPQSARRARYLAQHAGRLPMQGTRTLQSGAALNTIAAMNRRNFLRSLAATACPLPAIAQAVESRAPRNLKITGLEVVTTDPGRNTLGNYVLVKILTSQPGLYGWRQPPGCRLPTIRTAGCAPWPESPVRGPGFASRHANSLPVWRRL